MKTIKIMMMALMMCLVSISFSQERESKPLPKIGVVNSQLTSSKGWLLNPESQWVSRQNRIPFYIENQYKTLIDYEERGLGIDNFISYQFRNVKIGDSTYVMLIKKYKDGYFRYSSIKEGWENYNSVVFFILRNKELLKLKNLKNDSTYLIELSILHAGAIDWIDNEKYISDIQSKIVSVSDFEEKKEHLLYFYIRPCKSEVQFQIYSVMGNRYRSVWGVVDSSKYLEEFDKIFKKPSNFDGKFRDISDIFKNFYYESDNLSFKNFINLNK